MSLTARAQVPVIDHLWIDDPTGRLTIFGSFGSTPGTVYVDSELSPFSSWSPDSVVCTIPDTGRGSCGPVQAVNAFGKSGERLLSAWYLWGASGYEDFGGGWYLHEQNVYLSFRLDLLLAIRENLHSVLNSSSSSTSYLRTVDSGQTDTSKVYGQQSFTTGALTYHFDLSKRMLTLDAEWGIPIEPIVGNWIFTFDSNYILPPLPPWDQPYRRGNGTWENITFPVKSAAFLPTDAALEAAKSTVASSPGEDPQYQIIPHFGMIEAMFNSSPNQRTLVILDELGRLVLRQSIAPSARSTELRNNLPRSVYFAILDGRCIRFVITE